MAGFFDTLFGGGAEREAARRNEKLTADYGKSAQGFLKTGYDTGVGNLNQAVGAYAPLSTLAEGYNRGGSMWQNALGLGGAEGNAAATGAFQAGPGYQFAMNQGLDAVNRRRAAGGMYDSGNADIDTMQFSQGLANQEYQNWLKNLQASGQTGATLTGQAATGQAGGYTNLANLAQKYAGDQTGVAGNQLSSNVNSSNLQAQGEASGAKNLLGAGMSLASMAMGLPPGVGGMGSSLFGGGTPTGQTFGGYGSGSYGSGMMGGIRYPAV